MRLIRFNASLICSSLLVLISFASMASAQNAATPAPAAPYVPTMTFDVASVRESKPVLGVGFSTGGEFEPSNSSHLTLKNMTLQNIVGMAYPVISSEILGMDHLPGELHSAMFNVQAKADEAAGERLAKLPDAQLELEQQHMLQALLAERFNLKVHWETRDAETYDLVVLKPGKLQSNSAPLSPEQKKMFGENPPPLIENFVGGQSIEYIAHGLTAAELARMLQSQLQSPVHDKTGLTGKYDFDLKASRVRDTDFLRDETDPLPSLETAIQEQLGLKLVRSRVPVKFPVIDHAEMPSPN